MSLNHLVQGSPYSTLAGEFADLKISSLSANQFVATDASKNLVSQSVSGIAPITPYMVGALQPFSTIQAAVNQAVADGHNTSSNAATVFVTSGLYVEDVVLAPFINISGINTGAVYVRGSFSMDFAGTCVIDSILLAPGSLPGISITGSLGPTVTINDCMIQHDIFSANVCISISGNATTFINNCFINATIFNAIDVSGGTLFLNSSVVFAGSSLITATNASNTIMLQCILQTNLTVDGANTQQSTVWCLLIPATPGVDVITVTNSGLANSGNSIFVPIPGTNVVAGDGTGSFNRGGCISASGVTSITGVTASVFPTI
jgi:hypothetical protein